MSESQEKKEQEHHSTRSAKFAAGQSCILYGFAASANHSVELRADTARPRYAET